MDNEKIYTMLLNQLLQLSVEKRCWQEELEELQEELEELQEELEELQEEYDELEEKYEELEKELARYKGVKNDE